MKPCEVKCEEMGGSPKQCMKLCNCVMACFGIGNPTIEELTKCLAKCPKLPIFPWKGIYQSIYSIPS